MGVLTDFVIADPDEAERVCESAPSEPEFEWFEAKGVLEPQVASLRAAALGQPFESQLPESLRNMLYIAGEDGPGLYEVPPDLVDKLASLDADGLAAIVERWTNTPDGFDREGARYVVSGLASLCRRAREKGKSVLLSIAL